MQTPPSQVVVDFLTPLPKGRSVLDLACGGGRHTRLALELGHQVTAVDIDVSGLRDLGGQTGLNVLEADLEGASWPFEAECFDVVIVANYLWRPLLTLISASVRPGGLLLYETFGVGNEAYGKPSNPEFLLKTGELRSFFFKGFEVLHFHEGFQESPKPSIRQSFVGRKHP